MDHSWPFDDPPETAVVTLLRILDGTAPLRLVTHDEEDGCWQFLDGGHVCEEDAAVIGLNEMADFDPSVLSVADLPLGDCAWRRQPEAPWQRTSGDPPMDLDGQEG